MNYFKVLFLFLCLVPSTFGFGESKISAVQNGFPNVFRPITNVFKKILGIKPRIIREYAPDVINVTLSRNEVVGSCPTNQKLCSDRKGIGIYTEVSNPENDVITYVYKVSGGKIIGEGSTVVWDLSGEKPGTYTITAGVDNSCGVCGRTLSKEVRIVECPDCKTSDLRK